MATYNKNKPKSNVAKSAKKSSLKFKWWMAVVGVGIIALIGIVVLRFSHAGTSYVIGKISMDATSKDGHFYARYWACRSANYPFTTVLIKYGEGKDLKETYTSIDITVSGKKFSSYGSTFDKGATFFSIQADMNLTNYLSIKARGSKSKDYASTNSVRVGTIPYCN